MSAGCKSCGGRCCRNVYVAVTVFDAWRIAAKLRLPWTQFVDPMNPGPRGPMGLALRKNASDDTACTFLGEAEAGSLCSIYPVRPQICRVYPFTAFRDVLEVPGNVRCTQSDWDLSLIDPAQIGREVALYRAEEDGQHRLIDVWDACDHTDRTFECFCDYAAAALDHFFKDRDADADVRPLARWAESGLPQEIADAQAAWLADLEKSCRAVLR
jgi:Fe-S-cluster containining protein